GSAANAAEEASGISNTSANTARRGRAVMVIGFREFLVIHGRRRCILQFPDTPDNRAPSHM
ncbi:MAG: hypothetical protein QF363_08240, partial [Planctomycetaceae bacterium]|nr:hypothetical protein [Planctomycetaceae bacterium]